MPSPFPGMNPYLEQPSVWEDFQMAFATEIRESLSRKFAPVFLLSSKNVFLFMSRSQRKGANCLARGAIQLLRT